MAKRIEKVENTSYEGKIKKRKRNGRIRIALIALFILVFVAYIINAYINKEFNSYTVVNQMKRIDSSTVKYIPYGKNLLKYSRDGASAIDGVGGLVWNGTFEMNEPSVDICEDYVAVGDIDNKDVYVFDAKGVTKKLEMLLPIMQVDVASQGVVAVVLDDKDINYIKIVDAISGDEVVSIKTLVQKNGYPVDISISNDGKKLVTSYLSVKNGVLSSYVSFYNFGSVGQSEIDRIVGGYEYGQIIVPKVEFINNDTVCAYGENKFVIYSMKQKPSVLYEEIFDTEIKSIFSNEKYIGFILENSKEPEKNRILIYNLKGKKLLDKNMDNGYENVLIAGDEIIFKGDLECVIINVNGDEKFRYTFTKNVAYIFPINNYNKYFLIDESNIEVIKLMEGKK